MYVLAVYISACFGSTQHFGGMRYSNKHSCVIHVRFQCMNICCVWFCIYLIPCTKHCIVRIFVFAFCSFNQFLAGWWPLYATSESYTCCVQRFQPFWTTFGVLDREDQWLVFKLKRSVKFHRSKKNTSVVCLFHI